MIRDLSTFADSGTIGVALLIFGVYLLTGILFYSFLLAWPLIDTLVFIFTSFTTIGTPRPPVQTRLCRRAGINPGIA